MIDGMGRGAPAWLAVSAGSTRAVAEPIAPAPGKAPSSPPFGALVREMAALAPIDAGRVAALRTAIASGSYAVDADAIAARIIAFDGSGRR